MFACAGPSRAGKSTICRDVAEKFGLHFHDASVGALMRKRGIDMVAPMTAEERIGHQQTLLQLYVERLSLAPRPAITDRTPLDMAAYALAEIGMHDSSPELGLAVVRYVEACIQATALHFDMIFLVMPLSTYAAEEGKPPPSIGYQAHIHYLIRAFADRVRDKVMIYSISEAEREVRADLVGSRCKQRLDHYAEMGSFLLMH